MKTLGVAAAAASLWIAAAVPPDPAAKKAPTAAKKRAASAKKGAVSKKNSSGSKKSASPKKKKASWRAGQMSPTPERYREIQTALARTGYFGGPPTGVWDADSIEALKRFQAAQNLKPDGKIDALSLIALGLGPKREPQARLAPPANPRNF
jgi:peptidoglycan hydrolase-like protein with peptidoglycan-binding domain